MILKPKNKKVYVPGYGVIGKEDFSKEHLDACCKQVKAAGLNVDEYLKKHMEIASYEDLPLFGEQEEAPKKRRKKKQAQEEEQPEEPQEEAPSE